MYFIYGNCQAFIHHKATYSLVNGKCHGFTVNTTICIIVPDNGNPSQINSPFEIHVEHLHPLPLMQWFVKLAVTSEMIGSQIMSLLDLRHVNYSYDSLYDRLCVRFSSISVSSVEAWCQMPLFSQYPITMTKDLQHQKEHIFVMNCGDEIRPGPYKGDHLIN